MPFGQFGRPQRSLWFILCLWGQHNKPSYQWDPVWALSLSSQNPLSLCSTTHLHTSWFLYLLFLFSPFLCMFIPFPPTRSSLCSTHYLVFPSQCLHLLLEMLSRPPPPRCWGLQDKRWSPLPVVNLDFETSHFPCLLGILSVSGFSVPNDLLLRIQNHFWWPWNRRLHQESGIEAGFLPFLL